MLHAHTCSGTYAKLILHIVHQVSHSVALSQVLQLLFSSCETEEECRNVVAECLGHLAMLYPGKALPLLQQQSQVRGQEPSNDHPPANKRRRMVWSCHTLHGLLAVHV